METLNADAAMQAIEAMKDRIVAEFDPQKIILFGSYARGTFAADSDVDFLVVMDVPESKRKTAAAIDLALADRSLPLDVIVVTPEEFERSQNIIGHIVYPAVREGKVLYDRAA